MLFLPSVSYAFMMECWKQHPDERPSFQELVERLEGAMTEQVEYLDLKQLDETKAYYQVQESNCFRSRYSTCSVMAPSSLSTSS